MRIVPRQYYRRDIYGKEVVAQPEDEVAEEDGRDDDGLFKSYKSPNISASNALNSFIRLLIAKFRPHQLHTFWYLSPYRLRQIRFTIDRLLSSHALGGDIRVSLVRVLFQSCSGYKGPQSAASAIESTQEIGGQQI